MIPATIKAVKQEISSLMSPSTNGNAATNGHANGNGYSNGNGASHPSHPKCAVAVNSFEDDRNAKSTEV